VLLSPRRNNSHDQIHKSLFLRENLSLNSSYSKDRLIGLRELLRVFSSSIKQPLISSDPLKETFVLIVSGEDSTQEICKYVSSQAQQDVSDVIEKNNIRLKNIDFGFIDLFAYLIFSSVIVLLSFFSNKRTHISILLRFVVEFTYLSQFVEKRQKPQTLLFFNPFVGDTPFCCHFLKVNFKSHCIIIPSITPLSLINSYSIADEIIISSQYHSEEIALNPNLNFSVNKVTFWSPEGCYELSSQLHETSKLNAIGYYSHGQWIRNKINKGFGRNHIQVMEESILAQINEYINQTKIPLIIFLHPRENTKTVSFEKIKEYYSSFVDPENITFHLSGEKNIKASLSVFLGVGAFSSILLERLSLGLPTFIARDNSWDFPLKNAQLSNISFDAFDKSLVHKIDNIKGLNKADFFKTYNIEDYVKQ
jgi:hypothetical protein